MRVVLWTLVSLTALTAAEACAQNAAAATPAAVGARPTETSDEIIVRGRRLADFRVEVEKARIRAYDIFNEINSSDDFDVSCNLEQRTGTRLGRQACVARFEGRISSRAARDYISGIRVACQGQFTQDCMFDPNIAGYGLVAAKAVEGEAPRQRDLFDEEIHRLARTDLRFGQAILDFYDASVRYEEERKRPRERAREREE
jgi:hypothetical protein